MDKALRKFRMIGFTFLITGAAAPPPAGASEGASEFATVNVRSCLYLRVRPQYRSRASTCVSGATEVKVLATSRNGYSQVDVNGKVGYLYTRYLKPTEAPIVPTRGTIEPPPTAPNVLPPPRTLPPAVVADGAFAYRALWGNSRTRQAWTATAVGAIREHFASLSRARDIDTFCPGFHSSSRREQENCFLAIVGAVVKFESSFNPRTVYREGAPLYYNSVGLFQLSHNRRARECAREGARSEADLKNPILNLKCGIRIMAKLVANRGNISGRRGAGAYWSVLRRPGEHRNSKAKQIANMTKREFRAVLAAAQMARLSGDHAGTFDFDGNGAVVR